MAVGSHLFAAFVYRLGHKIFILGRAVRLCYAVQNFNVEFVSVQ